MIMNQSELNKVYRFEELPEESKAKALNNYRDILTDHVSIKSQFDHSLSWYASVGEDWIAEQKEKGLEYRLEDLRFELCHESGNGASADVYYFDPELFFPGKEGRILKWLEEEGHIVFNFYRLKWHNVHSESFKAEIVYRFDRQRYTKLYDLIDDAAYNLNDYLKSSFKDLEKRLYEALESDEVLTEYFVDEDLLFTLDGVID